MDTCLGIEKTLVFSQMIYAKPISEKTYMERQRELQLSCRCLLRGNYIISSRGMLIVLQSGCKAVTKYSDINSLRREGL